MFSVYVKISEEEKNFMTIHHDKLAYGRLAKTSEELSQKQIEEMLKELSKPEKDDKEEDKKEGDNK